MAKTGGMSAKDQKAFMKKQTAKEQGKLLSSRGKIKAISKELTKSRIDQKAKELGIQGQALKTSKKTLKKIKTRHKIRLIK